MSAIGFPSQVADRRIEFLVRVHDQMGKPYVWGAKGPEEFDCSGLVTWALYDLGICDWRNDHNAQTLYGCLPHTDTPRPGDLAFYGTGRTGISHVMVVWGGGPDGSVIGASGGNHDVTSVEIAQKKGARVQIKHSAHYRPDFVGYAVPPIDAPMEDV